MTIIPRRKAILLSLSAMVHALVMSSALLAQQAAPPAASPAPAVVAPATTPAAPPAPGAAPAVAPPAPGSAPAAGAPASPPVAAPPPASPPVAQPAPGDAGKNVDSAGKITEITARPVLRLKGKSSWDDGFDALKKSLATLDAEVKKLGLVTEGQPMAHFVDSDDNGFTFEALVPLKEAPAAGVTYSAGIDATQSPAGKVVMFQHEGAYDDIDSAYEAFTAWLDDKNLVSTGRFLEEYIVWPEKSDDTTMKLRITVFLK